MTSQPQVPGAPAVVLLHEEITEDKLHMYSVYVRLKVLNERGKGFANVELKYPSGHGANMSAGDVSGRTIQPDGSVVPFTGKPYEKLIEKSRDFKYMAKVFTMPDVRVGSILEYRYVMRWDDHYYVAPSWYIQSELFARKVHYVWRPTGEQLVTNDERGQLTSGIRWTPVLPPGAQIKLTTLPDQSRFDGGQRILELALQDIPPAPNEEHMPPVHSFTYRVLFYYSPYGSTDEFWKNEGKYWSKHEDRFIGPGPAVTAAVHELTQPSDTPEQKLRKLYAAVQKLENTDFSRSRSNAEEKAQGFSNEVKNTDDVWVRRRGHDDELTKLFVAMARAAGLRAYVMRVTDRDRSVFFAQYLSMSQLNDDVAIVTLDGKERYFDPGSPFVPFGQLAWQHDVAGGVRQTDGGGSALASTPGDAYTSSVVQRVANLTMNNEGEVRGTITMSYVGLPAVEWRQRALSLDEEAVRRELTNHLEDLLPNGLEVHLSSLEHLTEAEQPLLAVFDVKGRPGNSTGKRMLLPGDLFESHTHPMFPEAKREMGVYFQYAHTLQDAIRINFPAGYTIESIPAPAKILFQKAAFYELKTESAPTSVTVRRNYVLGDILFLQKDYTELRGFFGEFEGKDQQAIVLKQPAAAAPAGNPGGGL